MLFYLLAGCLVVLAVIFLSRYISNLEANTYRRVVKWIGWLVLLGAAIMLLKAGWPLIAAAVGGIGVFLPKLLRWIGIFRMLRGLFGARGQRTRKSQAGSTKASSGAMTRAQAASILGIKEDASAKEIKARYQHLMKQVHPDKGGSEHFAQQLNDAKDVLLKQK